MAAHSAGVVLAIANVYEGHSHDPAVEKIFDNLPEENTASHVAKVFYFPWINIKIISYGLYFVYLV